MLLLLSFRNSMIFCNSFGLVFGSASYACLAGWLAGWLASKTGAAVMRYENTVAHGCSACTVAKSGSSQTVPSSLPSLPFGPYSCCRLMSVVAICAAARANTHTHTHAHTDTYLHVTHTIVSQERSSRLFCCTDILYKHFLYAVNCRICCSLFFIPQHMGKYSKYTQIFKERYMILHSYMHTCIYMCLKCCKFDIVALYTERTYALSIRHTFIGNFWIEFMID